MGAKKCRGANESGFTLIELMIVVAIIGILAAVALPKFAASVERARESATRGNLNTIRSAISMYYGDAEGIYPKYLDTTQQYMFSRYIADYIPAVKATHSGIGVGTAETPSGTNVLHTNDADISGTGRGWRYTSSDGLVFVNSAATDTKGLPYSTYGY